MLLLGLHFGHDSGVAVVRDGRVLVHLVRERLTRVKHAGGLDTAIVQAALDAGGITLSDIDAVAVSSTQGVELLFDEPTSFSLQLTREDSFGVPCSFLDQISAEQLTFEHLGTRGLAPFLPSGELAGSWLSSAFSAMFPDYAMGRFSPEDTVPFVDSFITRPHWDEGAGLAEIGQRTVQLEANLRYGFHLPLEVTLLGQAFPGYLIHHHLAHAANSYYTSGFAQAAVLSHDGHANGQSYHGGMFYYGNGKALYPIAPHHLNLGAMYDRVGQALGLGHIGPAGKLMGLAAYGKPAFADDKFIGNYWDAQAAGIEDLASSWLVFCRARASEQGYDLSVLGRPESATEPINADIAASTQQLFEEVRARAVATLAQLLQRADLPATNLCLTGGTALNCPSNTQIAEHSGFKQVHVEPTCDDSGIAVGAALVVHHSLLGAEVEFGERHSAYVGRRFTPQQVVDALAVAAGELTVTPLASEDIADRAVEDLLAGCVVAWFEGASEVGPRALCHRSLLVDPRAAENWARVNQVKGRESWRPFAPVVLEDRAADWFRGLPLPSPYMLFNADVSEGNIPAVKHIDGTSRIQTVDSEAGGIHRLLSRFAEETGVPVLMNTSFNGPGEPIVDSPADALATFLELPIDVLYIDGHRVTKVNQSGV
ncbi:carbamoyltransferase C-terminal domain-containing protein [Rhodococcus tibetensis]|uniref:Carbamoyltransferase n=1 Tax=Rhodococcus tibetensis TaxID=2965064 RepID=A0ABT1QJI7_9NOCA|nr:carbamoyltransferase C-terminal domain-containing protein [Rhodococcus sp. FXJ9.536]MCQ4122377.1 hypothetical protein [Rhodococcus sp. FXJ9.536]